MINAFFRPPAKRAPAEVVSRPASPPVEVPASASREPWTLIDDSSSGSIDAFSPSLSDLEDVFEHTPTQSPTRSPPCTRRSTPGLPSCWSLGSPDAAELCAHAHLVMPTPLASREDVRAHQVFSGSTTPELDVDAQKHLQPSSALSLRDALLPVGGAIAASCATLAYHALGSIVVASYDVLPATAVPVGIRFLAANYPMASLVGTAAGSLWGLHHLCRPGSSGNVRANRASMCVSALTTSFWLFAMGPAAIVGTAGSMIFDLAQPAAQTYLLSALGLIYNSDLLNIDIAHYNGDTRPPLMLEPQDVEAFLALSQQPKAETSEPS